MCEVKGMKGLTIRVGAALLSVLFFFLILFPSQSTVARAESAAEFEKTNVMDDLEGSEIDGKPFELKDYAFDKKQDTQVLMLVEYCYSFYVNRQDNFGLYLYVWNPQGITYRADSELNTVQLSYGDDADYVKYPLLYLNRCERTNYEGLFYKYKIELSMTEKEEMLDRLNSRERTYHISGMELVAEGEAVHDYPVNAIFSYSGYAKGYGANAEADDTLTYSRTSGDVFIIKDGDLHQTFYRPKGTDGSDYQQDTLHTVYFTVPNELIKKYGRLAVLRVQWLEAVLSPFLVTGNQEIYNALQAYIGKEMGAYEESGFEYGLLGGYQYESSSMGGFTFVHKSAEVAYNPWYSYLDEVTTELNRICLAFLSENKTDSADSYTVGGEQLLEKMREYSRNSTDKVLETYDRKLFSSVANEFTVVDIPAEKEYSLTSEKISQTFWEKLTGKSHVEFSDIYNNIQAIYPVSAQDFGQTKEQTCQNLYIDLNDYDEFQSVYNAAVKAEETVYLFRFAQSKYSSWEVTEGKWKKSTEWVSLNGTVGGSFQTVYKLSDSDTNAYFGQETVYLGLDLIQMEWDDGGKRVVIPIVSSPIDVVADGTPPVYTTSDARSNWWKLLLGVIAFVIIVVLLLKFAPWLIYGIGKLIAVPFKALAAAGKSGRERRREKRKERKTRKAQKQMDKEFDDFHKKCRREDKKVQRDWRKVDVEPLKKKIWSGEMSESDLTKTQRYALDQDEEWQIEKEIEEAMAGGYYEDEMDWWMT